MILPVILKNNNLVHVSCWWQSVRLLVSNSLSRINPVSMLYAVTKKKSGSFTIWFACQTSEANLLTYYPNSPSLLEHNCLWPMEFPFTFMLADLHVCIKTSVKISLSAFRYPPHLSTLLLIALQASTLLHA